MQRKRSERQTLNLNVFGCTIIIRVCYNVAILSRCISVVVCVCVCVCVCVQVMCSRIVQCYLHNLYTCIRVCSRAPYGAGKKRLEVSIRGIKKLSKLSKRYAE